jgi:peptidoglycan/xylan/chitin deacetylase (PgdA/CDA1 family)
MCLMHFVKRFSVVFAFLFLLLIPSLLHAQTTDPREAKISLTFDDGFKSTYTLALPILNARGIKAVEFPTTKFIDDGITGDGFPAMTWQQVQSLQNDYGWEIGSHTVTHPELPTVSLTTIKNELTNSKATLQSKGLNVTSLATPYGAYDNNVLREALKIYNLQRGFWDRDDANTYPYNRDVVMVQSEEKGVTVAQVKTWIDQAISQKKWLVLVFHDTAQNLNPNYEYTVTTNDLTQIADYIKQKNIKVVSMDHTLQKPGANVFVNSTFDNGMANGWTTNKPNQITSDSNNNGSYPSSTKSIKLVGTTTASKLTSPFVSVTGGNTYSFQTFINADLITSGNIAYSIEEYGSNNNLLSTKSLGNVGIKTIKYFSSIYTPTSTVSSIKVVTTISANAKGTAYVDNYELYNLTGTNPTATLSPTPTNSISLTPTSTPTASPSATMTPTGNPTNSPTVTPISTGTVSLTPSPTGTTDPNLAGNGSFESLTNGWPNNWTKDSISYSLDTNSNGDNGTNSIHLLANTTEAHLTTDKISVAAGTTYQWKQYIKTVKAQGEFGFYIDEYNANGAWISWQWKGAITANFTGVKQFAYKPTSTSVKTAVLNYYADPNSSFDLYLDSVSLSK